MLVIGIGNLVMQFHQGIVGGNLNYRLGMAGTYGILGIAKHNIKLHQLGDGLREAYAIFKIIKIMEVRQPEPKTFKEARGVVTSGYQAELEIKWLEQLREKYSVTVDEKLLNKVKENYNN